MGSKVSTTESDPGDAIFTKDGAPVRFHFHDSVREGRDRITRNVEDHGGRVVQDEREANVLLVDEEADIEFIRRRYYSSTDLFRVQMIVEPRGFVQGCIKRGTYRHIGPKKQGMPGVIPVAMGGRGRVNFTTEDDEHLAYHLATIYPDKATGGRLGISTYKDLVDLSNKPEYGWARRHTAQSWRERYKKQAAQLDPMIDRYAQRLKHIGHTFGHDRRSRLHRVPWHYDEEEEDEDEEEEEEEEEEGEGEGEEEEQQGPKGQRKEAGSAAREPADAAARDHLSRNERALITLDKEDDSWHEEQMPEREPQRMKRHRPHSGSHRQSDTQGRLVKRARLEASSSGQERQIPGVEQGRRKSGQSQKDDVKDADGSSGVEGSDLFGDREYGEELQYDFENLPEVEIPAPHSPRSSPVLDDSGPPAPTQATLVASPRAEEEKAGPSSSRVAKARAWRPPPSFIPPSSQVTLVMTQERVAVQRTRGAPVQPGPSVPVGPAPVEDAPYRHTRARSRSVEPQPATTRADKGKGKAKQAELEVISEDEHPGEENEYPEGVTPLASSSSLPTKETLVDEMDVEDLLADDDDDDDDDDFPALPRIQEIADVDEPSDSDDAETYRSLQLGPSNREGSQRHEYGDDMGFESRDSWPEDEDEGEDNDRLERMAKASLTRAPSLRMTRSMAQLVAHAVPRRTRESRNHIREPHFPSSGTKAREVVDRINEEKRMLPYTPPRGSKAARVVKMQRG
ncbi:hypothetical protein BS17DRAFT_772833 [Gyrodon lividus]|nr:hypothetical protein BS17DRAFT_772833 [Gyrodon lividus]